ncbi:MAG: carboxypeptidase-like regulatory domain-containing protein [Vicinamibacterales bacterium]
MTRRFRLPWPLFLTAAVLAGFPACGGNPYNPSNNRWNLHVVVTTEGGTPIAGATLRIVDGPNQGRAATTDVEGRATIADLQQGGFTVEVSAAQFATVGVGITLTSDVSVTVKLPVVPVKNAPPVIIGLTAGNNNRAEEAQEVDVAVTVQDDETPPEQMEYEWSAPRGTFSGAGPLVKWKAPKGLQTPAEYELKVTVVEKYTELDESGLARQQENRTSGAVTVHVNDSPGEITAVVMTFLDDFAHSNVSPEVCVRNFSDSCAGKAAELSDITDNRKNRQIDSASFRVNEVVFNDVRSYAWVKAPCEFRSFIKDADGTVTNKVEVAKGDCLLEAVYENWRWWLCDSKFRGQTSTMLRFVF